MSARCTRGRVNHPHRDAWCPLRANLCAPRTNGARVEEGDDAGGGRAGSCGGPGAGAEAFPRALIRRGWRYTDLQFEGGVSQSRMRTFRPGQLAVDYTRTMMASLLWRPRPGLIGMVGLGGGAQVKFCHRHLSHARVEVAEINPHVVALRRRFRVPDDDSRLRVHLADGAHFVRDFSGRFDIL